MISVVIPLYNKARHIEGALKSVLAQTCKPHEIIVIDDGSTDQGSEIVRQYISDGIRLIARENRGVSAARNLGLQEANAKFVAFLDADDYWLPNHLEILYCLIDKWPDANLFSTSHYIKRDDRMYVAKSTWPTDWAGVVDDFFGTYAKNLSLVNSSTACVSRRALLENGGFPLGVRRGEDVVAWIRLALGGVVIHKATATAVYNQEAENRCTLVRVHEPPGSLLYLAMLLSSNELKDEVRDSVAALLDRMALVTAAGFHFNGDTAGARMIANLARKAGRIKTALAIRAVILMPLGALMLARTLRHKRVV